jgi:hypothetical protein
MSVEEAEKTVEDLFHESTTDGDIEALQNLISEHPGTLASIEPNSL